MATVSVLKSIQRFRHAENCSAPGDHQLRRAEGAILCIEESEVDLALVDQAGPADGHGVLVVEIDIVAVCGDLQCGTHTGTAAAENRDTHSNLWSWTVEGESDRGG